MALTFLLMTYSGGGGEEPPGRKGIEVRVLQREEVEGVGHRGSTVKNKVTNSAFPLVYSVGSQPRE